MNPFRVGIVKPDGAGGWAVWRHGQGAPWWIGLASRAEGIKLLYAIAAGWASVRVVDVKGRVLRVPLIGFWRPW